MGIIMGLGAAIALISSIFAFVVNTIISAVLCFLPSVIYSFVAKNKLNNKDIKAQNNKRILIVVGWAVFFIAELFVVLYSVSLFNEIYSVSDMSHR